MEDNIGQAAGQIWKVLSEAKKPVNLTEIAKKTHLPAPVAYQGLGWLAREGKVLYQQQGRSTIVSLT